MSKSVVITLSSEDPVDESLTSKDLVDVMESPQDRLSMFVLMPDGQRYPVRTMVFHEIPRETGYPGRGVVFAAGSIEVNPTMDDLNGASEKTVEKAATELPRRYFVIGTSFKDCLEYQESQRIFGFDNRDTITHLVWDVDQFEWLIKDLTPEERKKASSHWTQSAQRRYELQGVEREWFDRVIELAREAAGLPPSPEEPSSSTAGEEKTDKVFVGIVGVDAYDVAETVKTLPLEDSKFEVHTADILTPPGARNFVSSTYGKEWMVTWTDRALEKLEQGSAKMVLIRKFLKSQSEPERTAKGYLIIGENMKDASAFVAARPEISGDDRGEGGTFFRLVYSRSGLIEFIKANHYEGLKTLEVIWTERAHAKAEKNVVWGVGMHAQIDELGYRHPNLVVRVAETESEEPKVHVVIGLTSDDCSKYTLKLGIPLLPDRLEQVWNEKRLKELIKTLGKTPVKLYWASGLSYDDAGTGPFYDHLRNMRELAKQLNVV